MAVACRVSKSKNALTQPRSQMPWASPLRTAPPRSPPPCVVWRSAAGSAPGTGRTPPCRRPWRRRGWDPPPAAAGGWEPCCCCRCRGPNVADSGGYNTFFWEKPMVGDIKNAKTHANTANTTKYMQNQKSANITCKYQ